MKIISNTYLLKLKCFFKVYLTDYFVKQCQWKNLLNVFLLQVENIHMGLLL
jgi:hypothetical protein